MSEQNEILNSVKKYYTEKILKHGATPAGVDWNSQVSQELRFEQLLKVIQNDKTTFSILDYGCGYGSMYEFLKINFDTFEYLGFDISPEMIKNAAALYPSIKKIIWQTSLNDSNEKDYVISSGIFNVRQEISDKDWQNYIIETLHRFDKFSKKGFSFNALTKYSDAEFMKEYLYYADPLFLFDYCKKHFSKYVCLIHDYKLYEFTIIVRKEF